MSENYLSVADLAKVIADPEGTIENTEDQDSNTTAEVSTEEDEAEALEGETESDETPDDEEDGPSSEDDADEDTDAADADDEDAEFDLEQPIPVKGQDAPVPLGELINGYLRQSDYTRKTQEIAADRKALAEERAAAKADYEAVRQERAQYAQLIPALQAQINAEYSDETMLALRETDYTAYLRKKEEYQIKMNSIQQERARLAQENEKSSTEAFQAELSQQFDNLFTKRPDFKDEKVWTRVRKDVLEFGETLGYSREELAHATDHRAILALIELMELKKSLNKSSKSVQTNTASKKTVPVASKNQSVKQKTQLQRASERLSNPNKPGKVKDLAALFRALDD